MEFLAGQLTFLGIDDFIFKTGTFSLHDPTEREASPIALPIFRVRGDARGSRALLFPTGPVGFFYLIEKRHLPNSSL